jgi:hypothetical protein
MLGFAVQNHRAMQSSHRLFSPDERVLENVGFSP